MSWIRVVVRWCTAELESVRANWLPNIADLSLNLTGRSVTIVAAYLVYSRDLDAQAALDLIREARSVAW
jgi:hypothetical protein